VVIRHLISDQRESSGRRLDHKHPSVRGNLALVQGFLERIGLLDVKGFESACCGRGKTRYIESGFGRSLRELRHQRRLGKSGGGENGSETVSTQHGFTSLLENITDFDPMIDCNADR
jgi:hypothetical protein